MLVHVLIWFPLYNITVCKYILICVHRNKMFWKCILFPLHPSLLRAVASDVAVGKGRGLLWAVSNHGCISKRLSLEESLTQRDAPLRALQP